MKEQRFEKVVEWERVETKDGTSLELITWLIFLFYGIAVGAQSFYFLIPVIILYIIGMFISCKRKVYWRKIKSVGENKNGR